MKRSRLIGLVAGATVATMIVAGAVWFLTTRPESAESAAGRYLEALSTGDWPGVAALLPSDLADPDQVEAAFTGATEYVVPGEIDLQQESENHVHVEAAVDVGDAAGTISFDLNRAGSAWVIAGDFLTPVTVTTTLGDSLHLGGALVAAGAPHGVLPALYGVSPAPASMLDGAAELAAVGIPVVVSLTATLAPEATSAAQEQIDAYAHGCAEASATVPDHCGIRVPWGADLATLDRIAFRVDAVPEVAISSDATSFDATGGVIVATADGTARDGSAASATYHTDDWALRGSVRFTGDELVLSVR